MATITSAQNGYWEAASTWVGGVPPAAGDVADINHNVTIQASAADQECANIDVQGGKTLALEDGTTLTELTASLLGGGTLSLGAGCTFAFNSASNLTFNTVIPLVRGTADDRSTITNVGVSGVCFGSAVNMDAEYCDFPAVAYYNTGGTFFRMVGCDVIGCGGISYGYIRSVNIEIRDCWFSGFGHSGGPLCQPSLSYCSNAFENITFGTSRNGTVAANNNDMNFAANRFQRVWGRNVIIDSTKITGGIWTDTLVIDNWMHTKSTAGTPGLGLVYIHGIMLAIPSTSAKKDGTYGVRVTPKTADGWSPASGEPTRANLTIPILLETAQTATVAGYVRRHGMTHDCAQVLLDSINAVSVGDSDEPTMTVADTWYAFSVEVTATADGYADLVLQVREYAAASYVDWADVTVTMGTSVYSVNAAKWFNGNPTLTSQAASGSGTVLNVVTQFQGGGSSTSRTTGLYQPGDTAIVVCTLTDADGDAADPADSVTISIWDRDGTLQVDGVSLTKADTGSYYYNYTLDADADVGDWQVSVKATDGSRVSIQTSMLRVESFPDPL